MKPQILSNVAKEKGQLEWADVSMLIPHEPIRNDLRLIVELVTVENFLVTQRWKADTFFNWYDQFFYPLVHHHHDIEEKMFFPWICEKASLPPRFSEEHTDLLERLENIKNQRKIFHAISEQPDEATWKEAVNKLHQDLIDLDRVMVEHFDEEEKCVVPILQEHFTTEEHDATIGKIVESLGPEGGANMIPWVIDRMYLWGGDDQVKSFLNTMPLPPRMLYKFVWKSAYEKNNRGALNVLRSDSTEVPISTKDSCSMM